MRSCLHSERKGMRKALLEVIASKTARRWPQDILSFVKCTLLAVTQEQGEVRLNNNAPVKLY